MMRKVIVASMLFFAMECAAHTEINEGDSLADVVLNARHALALAQRGQYGPLTRFELKSARSALDQLVAVAVGKRSFDEFTAEEFELFAQARKDLDEVLRRDNKNRIVCTSRSALGTRIKREECLTIGDRERRALRAYRDTDEMQRTPPQANQGD